MDFVPTANDLFSSYKRVPNQDRRDPYLFCEKDHKNQKCIVENKMTLH